MGIVEMSTPNKIRVILFQEGDLFIAQGLELDICAQGKTPEEAKKRFSIALRAETHEAASAGISLFEAIEPAPAFFHSLYESGNVGRDMQDLPAAA